MASITQIYREEKSSTDRESNDATSKDNFITIFAGFCVLAIIIIPP